VKIGYENYEKIGYKNYGKIGYDINGPGKGCVQEWNSVLGM
jgi:hypothetical protein